MNAHRRPLLEQKRVKFYCRSFSLELYRLSSELYRMAGYPCVRLTDQTADGYFFTMLQDEECDVAINIDEDAFIFDLDGVLDLAEQVVREGYANAASSDAGGGCPRIGNPIVTNPFFNVFNLELIRSRWDVRESPRQLRQFSYQEHRQQLESEFLALSLADGAVRTDKALDFTKSDYEPYYNFFFWLSLHFPTLYLSSYRHADGTTTMLRGVDGRPFLGHTWFARFYHPSLLTYLFEGSQGRRHSQRIDKLIDEAYAVRSLSRPKLTWRESLECRCDEMRRWCVKVPQRIMNWPNKIRKKISNTK